MTKKRIIKGSKHKDKIVRRHEILLAAMQAFSDNGYQGTTIDKIAKRVNLSKGSVYRHFKNKEAIILAINDYYIEEIEARIAQQWLEQESFVQKIKIAMRVIHEFAADQVPLEHVWVELSRENAAKDKFLELVEYQRSALANLLSSAFENHEICKYDHKPMIDILMGFEEGLVSIAEMDPNFNILDRFDAAWPYLEFLLINMGEIKPR